VFLKILGDFCLNEFTKEELKLAHEYLCGNPRTWKLADKIQSMIDEYCDHSLRLIFAPEKGCSLDCSKCKKAFI